MFALIYRHTLTLRYVLAAALSMCIYFLWMLPSSPPVIPIDPADEYALLPDVDLAEIAEELWANNHKESALNILAYAIRYGQEDASTGINSGLARNLPLCIALEFDYTVAIADDTSLDSRIWRAGRGAVTGTIDSWEEMAGSTVADFFVVGDIRDLVVQTFIADETDALIVTLSALGLLTTAWPPADPAVSLLKAARKGQHISDPLIKQLSTVANAYKKAPSGKTQKAFLDAVKPIWELSGKCGSWSQMTLILKHSDSINSIAKINKILGKSIKNSRKLGSIVSVCPRKPGLFGKILNNINKTGQAGMDAVYSAIRKGPKGLSFVAKHPRLLTRVGKIAYKDGTFTYNELLRHYTHTMNTLRYACMMLAVLAVCLLTPLRHILRTAIRLTLSSLSKIPWPSAIARLQNMPRSYKITAGVILSIATAWCAATLISNSKNLGQVLSSAKKSHSTPSISPSTGATFIHSITREIRCDMHEVDDYDIDDRFHQVHFAPIICGDDASQWLIGLAPAFGLDWPEILDGDIDQLRYLYSKRGSLPQSSNYSEGIFRYDLHIDIFAIRLNANTHSPIARRPLSATELTQSTKLFIVKGDNSSKGFQLNTYSIKLNGGDIVSDFLPAHARPVAGDYIVDGNGALAGIMINNKHFINMHQRFNYFMKLKINIHSVGSVDGADDQNYYHKFVTDVRGLQNH